MYVERLNFAKDASFQVDTTEISMTYSKTNYNNISQRFRKLH